MSTKIAKNGKGWLSMSESSKRESTGETRLIIALLLLITMVAVCVTVWALWFRMPSVTLAPDYAPKEIEAHAHVIPNDSGEQKKSEAGGGSVSLTYSNQVSIDLSDETASLMFANPGKSNQNVVVQIVIQDQVIVQSGTILPGRQVTALDLLDGTASMLTPGGYDGNFSILYYHPESGEKAIVNTEIPIRIEVRD